MSAEHQKHILTRQSLKRQKYMSYDMISMVSTDGLIQLGARTDTGNDQVGVRTDTGQELTGEGFLENDRLAT